MSSKSCSRQKNSAYQDRNESFALLLQSKKVNWKKVYGEILKKSAEDGSKPESAHFADSMYHQAIAKACLDPEVCPQTLQLLLNRSSSSLATIDKIKLSMKATRCNNDIACHALLQTDNSMRLGRILEATHYYIWFVRKMDGTVRLPSCWMPHLILNDMINTDADCLI